MPTKTKIRLRQGMRYRISSAKDSLTQLTSSDIATVLSYGDEIVADEGFWLPIYLSLCREGGSLGQISGPEYLYILCRLARPTIVVETGVAQGLSTAFILNGLDRNGQGFLHSIDAPNYERLLVEKTSGYLSEPISILPEGQQSGWLVPPRLKGRWSLSLGLSHRILSSLLETVGCVDIFLHDSEHTYENMIFEYRTVWPFLKKGGLLLSHDIHWNTAFQTFAKEVAREPVVLGETAIGGLRK